jgi:hypothetical protein
MKKDVGIESITAGRPDKPSTGLGVDSHSWQKQQSFAHLDVQELVCEEDTWNTTPLSLK